MLYLFSIALPISLLDWSFHRKTQTIYLPIFHYHHNNNNKILNDHTFNSIQQTEINKCRVHPARLDHIPVPARPLCLVRKVSCVFDDDDDEAGAAVEAIQETQKRTLLMTTFFLYLFFFLFLLSFRRNVNARRTFTLKDSSSSGGDGMYTMMKSVPGGAMPGVRPDSNLSLLFPPLDRWINLSINQSIHP